MKMFKTKGVKFVFWKEAGSVFCSVNGLVYCCTAKNLPTTKEDALKMAETAWIW